MNLMKTTTKLLPQFASVKPERNWIECTCAHTGRKWLWSELTPEDRWNDWQRLIKFQTKGFEFFSNFIYDDKRKK